MANKNFILMSLISNGYQYQMTNQVLEKGNIKILMGDFNIELYTDDQLVEVFEYNEIDEEKFTNRMKVFERKFFLDKILKR